ncbi:MAG: phosphoribosylformylglycinamidine cyclo-ligase [Candidatus Andersenbacteria bacterium]|nr:phosphoribosylformylglycinamidine cyclo-ligase [Candidatus Andersenbacteria bacterium]
MTQQTAYESAGVNIDAGEHFVRLIRDRIQAAWPGAEREIGGFAGQFRLGGKYNGMACTDGSGTVAILCALTERWETLGQNAAAMTLVDLFVAGARPNALLDVLDVAKLNPEKHIGIIDGMITGCKMADSRCMLIGGETAELPDMFAQSWMVNVNTTAIGTPRYDNGSSESVGAGQIVCGWPSNGFGSNGFSLVRKVFGLRGDPADMLNKLDEVWSDLGMSLADAILQPTPIWISEIENNSIGVGLAAHAHITGGGLVGNIPRILPPDMKVVLDRSRWKRPPIFKLTQKVGDIPEEEMNRVFNQGLMMVSIARQGFTRHGSQFCQDIGVVEARKGNEPQVQFIGKFQS